MRRRQVLQTSFATATVLLWRTANASGTLTTDQPTRKFTIDLCPGMIGASLDQEKKNRFGKKV